MMTINERAEQKVNDVLMHYGVKGMKWGKHLKRKEEVITTRSTEPDKKTTEATKSSPPMTKEQIREAAKKISEETLRSYVFELQEKTRKLANSKELSEQIRERISARYQDKYHINKIDLGNSQLIFTNSSGDFKYEVFAEDEIKKIQKAYDSLSHSALAEEKVDSYLEHHGIIGMSWGVRHGPPYPLSKKKSASIKKAGKVTVNIKNLSDDQLRNIINRLQMEKQLKDLTKEDTKNAESWISKTLKKFGNSTVDTLFSIIFNSAKAAGTAKLTSVLKEQLGVKEESKKDKK